MARMYRFSVRMEKKVRQKIEKWAAKEGIPPAELSRRVFEWAFDQYSLVGELAALRKMAVASKKQKPVRKGKETK